MEALFNIMLDGVVVFVLWGIGLMVIGGVGFAAFMLGLFMIKVIEGDKRAERVGASDLHDGVEEWGRMKSKFKEEGRKEGDFGKTNKTV